MGTTDIDADSSTNDRAGRTRLNDGGNHQSQPSSRRIAASTLGRPVGLPGRQLQVDEATRTPDLLA